MESYDLYANVIQLDEIDRDLFIFDWEVEDGKITAEITYQTYKKNADEVKFIKEARCTFLLSDLIARRAYGKSKMLVEYINGNFMDCTRNNLRYTEWPKALGPKPPIGYVIKQIFEAKSP
jgi:hypothetical protein